ncbi:probable beta-D-xylosidase 2 isoform X2 [Argentina anserina]|uniref:probable beta-D-xylosidase 2 isoform X2 n=1 Tax=Argentina anserina TaxID=57926 RepID=UPI00217685C1|nr:probable beta-D-xylosidase 2 isoform X2 [Potentilla anserina]
MASATTMASLSLFLFILLQTTSSSKAAVQSPTSFACNPNDASTKNLPFCRVKLPIHVRVRDLIGRLTLQEKVKLLVNSAKAVPRLGIKDYEWWSEALHGVSNVGPGTKFGGEFPGATSFPQVITTAASFNASLWEAIGRVSKQDMEDTFDVPFRMCVKEGKVASVMCSYNQVNGVPTCADPNLLKKTVRAQWGLDGYIVSDCDSVGVFYDNQHYTSTPEEAAAAALKAGLDLDCGPFLGLHTEDAVKKGLLSEVDHIDLALANTLTVQMRLGMFDGSAHPYANLGPRDVCTPAHQQLALDAATQGIVLLKNRGTSLPLSTRRHRTVAVIGPNSDATVTMIGNYAGVACGYTTPLQGIGKYTRTVHQQGCGNVACNNDTLFGAAIDAARQADATILVMGLDQSIEAEFRDRIGLLLPGRQQELISRVASSSKGPTILVLMSGGPVDVTFAKNDPRIAGIVWAGYPGQAGGQAIADIVFGISNPGGKLPMTWYPDEYLKNLEMTDMGMRSRPSKGYPGRTYRFYKGPIVYPFGHGLGYTKFVQTVANAPTVVAIPLDGHHTETSTGAGNGTSTKPFIAEGKAIRVTHAKCNKLSLAVDVNVRNVGNRDGTQTLLVYSSPPATAGHWVPHKQLIAFEKVYVPARTQQRVQFNIHVCKHLSVVDRSGIRRIPMGRHDLHIGDHIVHSFSIQAASLGLGVIKS